MKNTILVIFLIFICIFIFGPDVLVVPALEAGVTSRQIYLPTGFEWKDALPGKIYTDGQTIDYKVEIEKMPVFTRNNFDFSLETNQWGKNINPLL